MLEKTSNLFNDKFLLNKFLKSFNVLKLVFIFSYCIRNIFSFSLISQIYWSSR